VSLGTGSVRATVCMAFSLFLHLRGVFNLQASRLIIACFVSMEAPGFEGIFFYRSRFHGVMVSVYPEDAQVAVHANVA
jgi:hypothetical protein